MNDSLTTSDVVDFGGGHKDNSFWLAAEKRVYLAGPITGLSYDEARHGWREEFKLLLPAHIRCVSPMRAKEFLRNETALIGDSKMYPGHLLAMPKGIVTRDRNDIRTCDAVVAFFLGAKNISIGTCIEFGWADAYRKPVVLIMEPGNVHDHAMITEIAGYITPSITEAAHVITHLLTPGV